jgi:hypothetical protein
MRNSKMIIAGLILLVSSGIAEDNFWSNVILTKPVCEAISKRWLKDFDGERRLHAAELWNIQPITVDLITNTVLCSFSEKFVFYRLGILRLEGRGKFREYDVAFAAVEEKGRIFLIGNDEETIKFLNVVGHPAE